MRSTQPTFKLEQNEPLTPEEEVIQYVADLDTAPLDWKISDVRLLASVSTAVHGNVTPRVAVGPRQYIAEWLLAKADVIRAMHERVQLG